ncbi:MAG: site-specific DNA-methyltransferase [Bacteroidota bacterium]|nr:site-specific DNA-methyltransferase [Bacteroidota bacterium]
MKKTKKMKQGISKKAQNADMKPVAATSVNITAAKGRPMLTWVGKRPLTQVTAFPAQLAETFDPTSLIRHAELVSASKPSLLSSDSEQKHFGMTGKSWSDWPRTYPKAGLLFHGDNKEVLAHLLANGFRGKVKLITTDPPFDSGADYVRKVSLRGAKGTTKLDGETYTLGEQIQYTDIWTNDNYLQFMYERLLLLKELLSEDGSLYLHCDRRKSHHLRALLDEIFGSNNFQNEIIWKRTTSRGGSKYYNHIHDNILFYTKGEKSIWNQIYTQYTESYLETMFRKIDVDGRRWRESPLTAPGTSSGKSGKIWKGINPALIGFGRHWAIPGFISPNLSSSAKLDTLKALDELEAMGRIVWSKDGKGIPNFKQYEDDFEGVEIQSIWTDVAGSETDYPTEKPEELLERILLSSSNPGDLVLDPFIGSGTTAAVAQKLGRRWIGCDINKGAIQTTSKRLQTIINEQVEEKKKKGMQGELGLEHTSTSLSVTASQLSFAVYRVNDYDLQIQHNEAVNLACEHIGISRTHNDAFFDGTLGKRLVKIVPFNHPLSPVDLEEIKKELKARPSEDRDIKVVCLGKELATDAWIEEWNRLRKKGDVPNKIEVIELRTDPKYGKFIKHESAKVRVKVSRVGRRDSSTYIRVVIEDFISPSIIERLNQQVGILQPKIDDWRSMVDCVMIDTNYNGEVFNVVLSDVPEKKTDLVVGNYEIPAPRDKTKVAVKIIDMLGEEVLEVREV